MTLESLLQVLADPATQPPASQLVHLSNIGPEQTSAFVDAWNEMELRKRRWLLDELIDLVEDNVDLNFDAVFLAALADRDPDVRRDAIRGLWEYAGRDLIDALITMLQSDSDAGVRAEAAAALGRFVLQAEFDLMRPRDIERVDEALRAVALDQAEVAEVRGRALEAVGARSEDWVSDLIQDAYESADRRLRLSALHAMGRNAASGWLPAVILELESDDAEMRFEAAAAAGGIADEQVVPHLLPLLQDEDPEAQDAAIAALGEIGGEAARQALKELLQEENERIREAVEAALEALEFAADPLGFTMS